MKFRTVSILELTKLGKWRADLHVHSNSRIKSDRFDLVPLGEVVRESRTAKEPREEESAFYYIGLEHIEPITGDHTNIDLVTFEKVRSRSKVFEEGDILYGRLRPYLRKAFLVEPPYKKGLCSTEFIVLKADHDRVLPLFLREILISDPVTEVITRLQAGAALPRTHTSSDSANRISKEMCGENQQVNEAKAGAPTKSQSAFETRRKRYSGRVRIDILSILFDCLCYSGEIPCHEIYESRFSWVSGVFSVQQLFAVIAA